MGITAAALGAAIAGDIENLLVAATPGGIEAQEARGQRDLCAASKLPKDGPREQLESIGIVYGDDADDIFVNVTIPAGWSVKPTSHSMWNDLVDEKGRKRAAIFYKAAFYDRSAHISLTRRFGVDGYIACDVSGNEVPEPRDACPTHCLVAVTDCGKVIFAAGHYAFGDYNSSKPLEAAARAWLAERYPNHGDPLAYWND